MNMNRYTASGRKIQIWRIGASNKEPCGLGYMRAQGRVESNNQSWYQGIALL